MSMALLWEGIKLKRRKKIVGRPRKNSLATEVTDGVNHLSDYPSCQPQAET
jgi:hypothetical protein